MCNISEMRDQLDYLENLGFGRIVAERKILQAKAQRLDEVIALAKSAWDDANRIERKTVSGQHEKRHAAWAVGKLAARILEAATGEIR